MKSETGIVLATDLGMRCDRATDRALALARAGNGIAIATTAVEPGALTAPQAARLPSPAWHHDTDPAVAARLRLLREFEHEPRPWTVQASTGRAADVVLATLDAAGPDTLAVAGPVREGVMGPAMLGSTVDALLRRQDTSLLTVRRRVHGPYRHLLLALDFSAPCRAALARARALFPEARVTALHGFDPPMLGMLDSSREATLQRSAAQLREQGQAFLAEAGADGAGVELLVEHGEPARLLQQYVESCGADLVVAGTHGRGAVHELVVGSVARRILTTVDADVLAVRSRGPR